MSEAAQRGTERYAVTGALGSGGMAAVYRAEDRQTGRAVALKRMRLPASDRRRSSFTELFHQEYRTLTQLAHPHVVRVYDFGSDADGPFYTMELLDGADLHSISPLPWREACALLRDVSSALALLHSRRLLHRDVSPKNVQRTRDGRAKLIDFGAMSPFGVCKTLVGTAPLVAPEALLQQPLDARADLYALGGTLYYALTGVHAYPARHMAQLRAMWRSPPPPPSARADDIPPELDALVLSLLSLEAMARPSSAAETLERLAAIAGLPRDEQLAVSHAYLSTPQLVGRAAELSAVRTRLVELQAGRGGVLWIEGASGMGRSRMLDTCVLEAKLAGMAVARASAADASSDAYGVASALARELWDLLPVSARSALDSPAASLLREGGITADVDATRRAELQRAFLTLMRAHARSQGLVIAVDDIERCDSPSQAALAAAAAAGGRDRTLIAMTCVAGVTASEHSPLALLRERAARVPLPPLQLADTEALLASLFSDAPHMQGLAMRMHERAEGSPRGCMELAQYLVDRRLVRYELGSWVLPRALSAAELPTSLSLARRSKLDALSTDARELAEALALAQGCALELEVYAELTGHGDRDRVRFALDELLLAQVLRNEGVHYVLSAQVWADELCGALSEDRLRAHCRRIAELLTRLGRDRLEIARYLWRAGERQRTIDTLLAELQASGTRWDRAPHDYVDLLRGAAAACAEVGRPRRDRIQLLRELVKVGTDLELPDLRELLVELFEQLRRDSGLTVWDAPEGPTDPQARLPYVLQTVQQRYESAAPEDRGLSPLEAIIALARVSVETCSVAAQTGDAALFDLLPSLEPFAPLSPAIERVPRLTIPSCRAVVGARYEQAREYYVESLAGLMDPKFAGIDEELRLWAIRALHYALGCIEAGLGRKQALEHAAELEKTPGWLVPSCSVQQIYHLTLGNLRQAERCRKQIELTLLQSPTKPPLAAGALHQHLFVFALSDNPNGMRQAIPGLEALAVSHPGLRPFVAFARADHARICGDCEEALRLLEPVREQCKPGQHPLWPWLMSTWLMSLLPLERYEEARAIGLRELATAEQNGLQVMADHIRVPLALAEAELGDFASACARLDDVISRRLGLGMEGITIGYVYEARARVALRMGDVEAFERNAQLCARQYRMSGGEPALAAKYDRLVQEARQSGVSLRRELSEAMGVSTTRDLAPPGATSDVTDAAIPSELASCKTAEQRAARALSLLVQAAGAQQGELFLFGATGLQPAASTAPDLGGAELTPSLLRLIDVGNEAADKTALTTALALQGPTLADGRTAYVWPMLLACVRDRQTVVAGIAALHYPPDAAVRLPLEAASTTAAALIDAHDVTPVLIGACTERS